MNKIMLYARATSKEAVDRQMQMMEETLAPGTQIIGRYSDVGPGMNSHQMGLQEALRRVTNGEADGLMVTSLDRVTRSIQKLARLKSMFRIKVCNERSNSG